MDKPEPIEVRLLRGRPVLFTWRNEIHQVIATLNVDERDRNLVYTFYSSLGTIDVIESGGVWYLAHIHFERDERPVAKKRR